MESKQMTKEELVEEAQKAYDSNDVWYKVNAQESDFKYGYIKGATPREKRIAKLEKENAELKSELHRVSLNEQLAINNGKNFLKQIAELEAQIAKLEKISEE